MDKTSCGSRELEFAIFCIENVALKIYVDAQEVYVALTEQQKQREQLEKQIATLEVKMKKEKQLNRKMELKAELKKLKKELEVL